MFGSVSTMLVDWAYQNNKVGIKTKQTVGHKPDDGIDVVAKKSTEKPQIVLAEAAT